MVYSSSKNYYEILEVSTNSTASEIKSAYRKLARKYHPDINKNSDAIEIFKEITKAYEILSNDKERLQYDIINGIFKQEQKSEQNTSSKSEDENYHTPPKNNKTAKNNKKNIDSGHKTSFMKSFKIWIAKLKRSKKIKDLHKPKKGDNITTEIVITPEEVITGSKRIINIRTTKQCPKCNGHRFANGDKCSVCSGTGIVTETKKITVSIPKGVRHGSKLRLKGEGGAGTNGGANGDVLLIVRVETKTQVHYDKLNIYYNVPITPFEAALGEEISIPSFDGTIKLKLPKNTCSGQKFRIAGQGIKKGTKIGDLIVTVSIEFSHNLSDDEIRLYEQLKNLSHDDVRKNFGYGN